MLVPTITFCGAVNAILHAGLKPVLRPLNTRDQFELRGGFPKTAEELYAYEAVVLDDLEAQFFTADQMSLLQKFVSERGGGLLMLGGAESFQ